MTRWYRPLAMIIVALWVSVWGVQRQYDQVRLQHIRTIQISVNEFIEPSLPSPIVLEKAAFGFRTVIADLLWLTTIQYYGGGDPYGKYRQLPKLVESITRLDPRFTYPYSFAGLVLPNEGFPDEALSILRTGEKSLPDSWELPYNEATIYYIDKKDSAAAAQGQRSLVTPRGSNGDRRIDRSNRPARGPRGVGATSRGCPARRHLHRPTTRHRLLKR